MRAAALGLLACLCADEASVGSVRVRVRVGLGLGLGLGLGFGLVLGLGLAKPKPKPKPTPKPNPNPKPKPKPKPNPSQASVGSVEAARAVPLLVALCGTASEMPHESAALITPGEV